MEPVGAIYPAVIGTVFIISSAAGASSVCLSDCYNPSMPTPRIRPCLRLISLKEQAIGSSWGGKKVILTGGHVHDSEAVGTLFKGIKLKGKTILADKAYSSEQIRFFVAEHEAVACIPDKANFRIKHDFDSELYKQRNIVERFFQRIKNYRHIATSYDKLAECFWNFVLLAASVINF